jgi:hypothetical protein
MSVVILSLLRSRESLTILKGAWAECAAFSPFVCVCSAICAGPNPPWIKTNPGGDRQQDDAAMKQPVNVLTRSWSTRVET